MRVLLAISRCMAIEWRCNIRLDGGAPGEEGASSSASLPRLRPPVAGRPRLAADMLGRSGELGNVLAID